MHKSSQPVMETVTICLQLNTIQKLEYVAAFRRVGRWSFENGESRSFLSENVFPPLTELYGDFGGRELVGATMDNWPFIKVGRADGGIFPTGGIDINVLDTIAERLNFTYRLVEPPDGQWGYPSPDGTISGMIGMAARHEVHFALSEITITDGRETVVDFTMPYHFDAVTITSRAPKQRGKALAIFWPFSFEVWLLLVAVVIAIGPVIFLFMECNRRANLSQETFRLQEVVFSVFRAMMVQGNRLALKSFPIRLAFMCWYIFCILISALYGGTLTAFLIIPAYEKPINSLVDLVAEAKDSGFILTIMKDTSQESILKEATAGIYKDVWDFAFDPNKSHVATQTDGFSRALTEKSGYITTKYISEIRTMRRGKHLYYIGRETFYPQGFGIACPSGSPYRKVFETIIGSASPYSTDRLFEGGLVAKWCQDELVGTRSSTSDSDEGEQDVVQAIALDHLQAAFFLLALGYALALAILFLEVLLTMAK
ncbi:glutamate receptor ionotropic, kainate 1-like [Oratosquilla oratoria]|uniref:glutamate receptor ionotropic, kainate 1-like n=1 Tax=Oratosquilla oratoria TaxID=337810 RepID=UPI003F7733BD